MDLRRIVLSTFVVLAVAMLVGCCKPCPECPDCPEFSEEAVVEQIRKDTRYVVIVPPEPEDGIDECRVIPFERNMEELRWLTFVNLANEPIHFFVSSQIAEKDEEFTLDPDQSRMVKIKELAELDKTYTVTSDDGGCFDDLASPRVIIP